MKRSLSLLCAAWRRLHSFRPGMRTGALTCALMVAGSTVAPPAAVRGAEEYERFLNGLRQRKYYDTALEYLDSMRNSPLLTDEQRQLVTFEEARTFLDAAGNVDLAEGDKLLDGARDRFEKFVKDTPDHPQAAGASTQLGAVLVQRGKNRVALATQAGTKDADKPKLMEEARKFFDDAEKVFVQAQEQFKKIYDSFPRFMPSNDPRAAQREAAKGELIKAHILHATGLYEKSQTFTKGSPEWKAALTTAAEKFNTIYKDYRTLVAGLSARLQEGKCYQELGDMKRALGLYNDLLTQPDELKDLAPYKASAMYLSLQCWTSESEKMYELGSVQADEFLKTAARENADRPEWLAVRYFGAIAHKLWGESIPADAKGEDAQTREQTLDKAREYAEYVANIDNNYQGQATDLLKDLSGGIAPDRKPKSFLEAQNRGVDAMSQYTAAAAEAAKIEDPTMQAAKLKEADDARNKALGFFKDAMTLADANTQPDQKNAVRYYTCYLIYTQQKLYDAAVIGEFLLENYPSSPGSRGAAQIALAAYVNEYQDNQDRLLNKVGPPPLNPEYDRDKMHKIAAKIAKQWPNSTEADNAWNILLAIAINEKNPDDIRKSVTSISDASPLRADAEMRGGRTLWALYSEQLVLDEGTPGRMSAADMQKLSADAYEFLNKAMEREKPKLAGIEQMTLQHAETQMFLCESAMANGHTARALECIDDPKIGLLALVRGADKNKEATVDPVKLESVKLALQAYVLNDKIDEAANLTAEMTKLLGTDATGGQDLQLANTYLNLALRIEKQIEQNRQNKDYEALKKTAKGFTFFLGELVKTSGAFTDKETLFQNVNWVSDNYHRLAADLVEQPTVSDADRAMAIGWFDISVDLDSGKLAPLTDEGSDAQLVVMLRKARSLRKAQKYDPSVDALAEILSKKPTLVEAQIEACQTLMEKGARTGDLGAYQTAITGGRPNETGNNVIWGWRRIADTMRGSPQFNKPQKPAELPADASQEAKVQYDADMKKYEEELANHNEFIRLFHTSRFEVAQCYMALAQATEAADQKKKHFNAVVYTIDVTQQYDNELGGADWKPKYEELKQRAAAAAAQL